MGYIENNLMKNEKIIYRAKIHWWIYAFPFLLVFVGLVLIISGEETAGAGVGLIILGAIGLIIRHIRKINSEFAVTNKRVILKQGVIKRNANEVVLSKAEGMNIDQGIFGRMLGFGAIVVTSGGASNKYRLIKEPLQFRKEINEQIEANNPAPTASVV
jgi:uncharacterized membrane protein YdbT with pleckstrin-like domain